MMHLSLLSVLLSVLLHQSDSLKPQQKITATTSKRKCIVLEAVTGSQSLLIRRKQQGMVEVNELSHSVLCSTPGQSLMENCTLFYLSVFPCAFHFFTPFLRLHSSLVSSLLPNSFVTASLPPPQPPSPPSPRVKHSNFPALSSSDLLSPPSVSIQLV